MLWQKGILEDFESSTGIFVDAVTAAEAVSWAEQVGEVLLRKLNDDETLAFTKLGYRCWIEGDPASSNWSHCLAFF